MTGAPTAPQGGWRPEGERGRVEALELEVQRLQSALDQLRRSESFRIGHRIVLALRAPRALVGRARQPPVPAGAASALPSARGAAPRLPVPSGPDWLGALNDGHATTLVIAWGLADDDLDGLVDDIARLQLMQRHFKPLFVTDSDHAAAFRRYGYAFEHVPRREQWAAHQSPAGWRRFVDGRMAALLDAYEPTRVLVFEPAGSREALRSGVLDRVIGSSAAVGFGERGTTADA